MIQAPVFCVVATLKSRDGDVWESIFDNTVVMWRFTRLNFRVLQFVLLGSANRRPACRWFWGACASTFPAKVVAGNTLEQFHGNVGSETTVTYACHSGHEFHYQASDLAAYPLPGPASRVVEFSQKVAQFQNKLATFWEHKKIIVPILAKNNFQKGLAYIGVLISIRPYLATCG